MHVVVNSKMSPRAAELLVDAGLIPLTTGVENAVQRDGWKALKKLPEHVLQDARIMLGNAYNIDAELLRLLPRLEWFHSVLSGIAGGAPFDWSLVEKRGIAVTTSKIHEHSVSEFALAHMLTLAKSFHKYRDAQKSCRYDRSPPLAMLEGKTALIVGTGNIGRELARKLSLGFDMEVFGINRTGRDLPYFVACGVPSDLDEMLASADFVILACAATDETRDMMNLSRFAKMRQSAFLVNVARGALVVENDLVTALGHGMIAGAGLDVFAHEPLPLDSLLWKAPNLFMTPHMAYSFPDSDMRVARVFLEEYALFSEGRLAESPNYANTRRY